MCNRRVVPSSKLAGKSLIVLVTALAAMSLVLAGSAGASHVEFTATVDEPAQLVSGVYLEVPVTVSCPDLAAYYVLEESVGVTVTQKAGREIARGGGSFYYLDDSFWGGTPLGTPLTCDGTAHTYIVNVFPSPGSPAFHGGKAVMAMDAHIDIIDPFAFVLDRSSVAWGPSTLSIRG